MPSRRPAFEVVDDLPEPDREPPRRAAPRPRRPDDDRDHDRDDWDDDRPRRRARRGRSAGGIPPGLLYGGIAAGVVGLLAVGLGVALLAKRGGGAGGPGGAAAGSTELPAGWKEFVSAEDGFKAYFPDSPTVGDRMKSFESLPGGTPEVRHYSYQSHPKWPDLACSVAVYHLPAQHNPGGRAWFANRVCRPSSNSGERLVREGPAAVGGSEGTEAVGEQPIAAFMKGRPDPEGRQPDKMVAVHRWAIVGDRLYHLRVAGREAPPKEAGAFFAHFTLTDAPKPAAPVPADSAKPVPPPAGWVAFQPAGAGFKTVMPTNPKAEDLPTALPSKNGRPLNQAATRYRGTDPDGNLVCEVCVVRFAPAADSDTDRRNAIGGVAHAGRPRSGLPRPVTWAGKSAREWEFLDGRGFARETHTATGGITAAVYGEKGKVDPEKARAFLDSFVFTE